MNHRIPQPRSGFTLIELLIVIALIGLLMSGVGVVVMNSVGGARIASTQATITKVQRQLQSRIEAVERLYREQWQTTQHLRSERAIVEQMSSSATQGRQKIVQRALMHKVFMRAYLPETWKEAAFLLKNSGKSAPATTSDPKADLNAESAELLYFFLSESSVVGFTPANQDLFTGSELKDTNKNGALEIVDGWGQPVQFYRWPTRLLRSAGYAGVLKVDESEYARAKILIPNLPASLTTPPSTSVAGSFSHDPDDPMNVLVPGNGWLTDPVAYEGTSTSTYSQDALFPLHTAFTWHTPLVVSAGPDREFGLHLRGDTSPEFARLCQPYTSGASEQNLYDNITSLNIKAGGR